MLEIRLDRSVYEMSEIQIQYTVGHTIDLEICEDPMTLALLGANPVVLAFLAVVILIAIALIAECSLRQA
jgi:hypothetical protein